MKEQMHAIYEKLFGTPDRDDFIPVGIGAFFTILLFLGLNSGNPKLFWEPLLLILGTPLLIWLKKGSFWQTE